MRFWTAGTECFIYPFFHSIVEAEHRRSGVLKRDYALKLVRRIVTTTLISALIFIIMFGVSIAITGTMLRLKELSGQTLKVLSDWNALDRITNDLLYYRLDSVSRLPSLEESWLEATEELEQSFGELKNNRLLKILPDEISRSVDEAWYLWLFANEKLVKGQRIFSEILRAPGEDQNFILEIEKITFYEKLHFLIESGNSYEDRYLYQSFLSHMYVLDITSESFSVLLRKINEDIPGEIEEYIYSMLLAVGLLLILAILVSLFSARKLARPIIQMADAVRDMGDDDYPASLEPASAALKDDELEIIREGFNRMSIRIHALYDESLRKEKEKRRAEFRALQYQINPHFLYNTLGSLRMKAAVRGDSEMAGNIQSLSRLLRNTITRSGSFITVSEEIEIMNDYLEIIQIRYKSRLRAGFVFSEDVQELFIPSLLFQPLLENAVLHGLNTKLNREGDEAVLEVRGNRQDDHLIISVYDNGKGMTEDVIAGLFHRQDVPETGESVHIGLKNIHDRIQLLFGEGYGIRVESEPGRFSRVTLNLPVIREEEDAEAFNR